MSAFPGEGETLDAIGALQILQRQRGYRFSIDALLLADFSEVESGPIVDLGSGSGIVALALARQMGCLVTAVELQPGLAALARRNATLNGLSDQVEVIEGDLRALRSRLTAGTFECAVSNPPFFEAGAGHVNPESEKALARHEVAGSIHDVACAARWLLCDSGRLCVVFPAERLSALIDALDDNKLALARLQCVHPRPDRNAHLILAEAIKNAPRTRATILAPLFLFDDTGHESVQAKAITARIGVPRSKGHGLPQRQQT